LVVLFAVGQYHGRLFPDGGSSKKGGVITNIPGDEYGATALFMLSDDIGGVPSVYVIVSYMPETGFKIIPLRSDILLNTQRSESLQKVYAARGAETVLSELNALLGTNIVKYAKFDKQAFCGFVDAFGKRIPIDVPEDINVGSIILKRGSGTADGKALFTYLTHTYSTLTTSGDSVGYNAELLGKTLKKTAEVCFRGIAPENLTIIGQAASTSASNFAPDAFSKRESAYKFTAESGSEIAAYYVPIGFQTTEGLFALTENATAQIRQWVGN
jgi:hypothetical protein